MSDKAGDAARRIEKAFTTGGVYSGDDPVTVARAYLVQAAEIERLRAALRDLINIPAVRQVLGERHTADCGCPLCRSRAALSSLPAQKDKP